MATATSPSAPPLATLVVSGASQGSFVLSTKHVLTPEVVTNLGLSLSKIWSTNPDERTIILWFLATMLENPTSHGLDPNFAFANRLDVKRYTCNSVRVATLVQVAGVSAPVERIGYRTAPSGRATILLDESFQPTSDVAGMSYSITVTNFEFTVLLEEYMTQFNDGYLRGVTWRSTSSPITRDLLSKLVKARRDKTQLPPEAFIQAISDNHSNGGAISLGLPTFTLGGPNTTGVKSCLILK